MKRLLLIPALLLFTIAANAQLFKVFGNDVGFIYVGPKVGANYSNISNFSEFMGTNTTSSIGYQFGAVGEFGFTSKFSVQTEILFYSRGAKFEDFDGKIRMNYIGIPLLAKYAFKAFGLTKIYAMGGTFTDVRTKGEWVDPGGVTAPVGAGFKKYDWGFSLGAGAEYPTKKGIWALDLRYNLGMVDLHDDVGDTYKTRSRSFGLALTYKFDVVDFFLRMKNKKNKENNENPGDGSKDKPGLKVDRSKE
jgi:hypothetical protein